MKSILKTIALSAAALMVTAGCNDYEDFDKFQGMAYPETIPFGHYESVNAAGDYDYSVVVTENAAGNKVVNVVRVGKAGTADEGVVRTLSSADNVAYDDTVGTMTAVAETSYFETAAQTTLIYKTNLSDLYLEFAYGKKRINANLKPSDAAPILAGKWQGNVNEQLSFVVLADTANAEGKGSAMVSVAGGEAIEATYQFVNGEGSVNFAGQEVKLAYNEKLQLTAEFGGQTFILDRLASDPEPEVFTPVYKGVFYHAQQDLVGYGLVFEGEAYEAYLCQSDKNANTYCIAPFLNVEEGIILQLSADNIVTIAAQGTGVNTQYGEMLVADYCTLTGESSPASTYDPSTGVFKLIMQYHVPAGTFGINLEVFQLTEQVSAGAAKKTLLQRLPKKPAFSFTKDMAPVKDVKLAK